jgi:hypothetical protein
MWNTGTIPTNWGLCDGTLGTPDLRSRFILGGSVTYPVNTSGGSLKITVNNLPSHTHTINFNNPSVTHFHGINPTTTHDHSVNDTGHSHNVQYGFARNDGNPYMGQVLPKPNPQTTAVVQNAGANLTLDIASTGITQTNSQYTNITALSLDTGDNSDYLPPYFTLIYIMRIR